MSLRGQHDRWKSCSSSAVTTLEYEYDDEYEDDFRRRRTWYSTQRPERSWP